MCNCPINALIRLLIANHVGEFCYSFDYTINRIYNKILDRDWFSARLFIMVIGLVQRSINALLRGRPILLITRMITDRIGLHSVLLPLLIKTITKFSNVIGYQQLDLSINWTVAHVMLVVGQYEPFCARCCGALF